MENHRPASVCKRKRSRSGSREGSGSCSGKRWRPTQVRRGEGVRNIRVKKDLEELRSSVEGAVVKVKEDYSSATLKISVRMGSLGGHEFYLAATFPDYYPHSPPTISITHTSSPSLLSSVSVPHISLPPAEDPQSLTCELQGLLAEGGGAVKAQWNPTCDIRKIYELAVKCLEAL
ncbi:unnamed protein product [Vitrella brassicaformis CCMP3155]|uniref:Uncharacterized protein n=2 Tax=Vitrella brassicaformis TaxID=1169539 RepID=A0A0G4GVR1_VITBC|nr:unnamed protein product [Vitrella brassicaformis CCMP3155]|eukprot:CEM35038.1 unnamed protein product [Vitrella brassicaformis CCMP3155]